MASSTPNVILLRGSPMALERKSLGSGTAITPGMLIEPTSAGLLRPHATAGGRAVIYVAREEEYVGGAISTAYALGDTVPFYAAHKGDQFYMLLEDEGNVALGAYLESNGAGELQALSTTGVALFRALEAVNNTGGSGAVRIRVEVL